MKAQDIFEPRRLIISAPFGNYLGHDDAISTRGTFTLLERPGRFKQVLRTVRHINHGWINQLGLRNQGSIYALNYYEREKQRLIFDKGCAPAPSHILSIHGFHTTEWHSWLAVLKDSSLRRLAIQPTQLIELNVSCPNVVDATPSYREIFTDFKRTFSRVIIKLPPINYEKILDDALTAGIARFHACNTYPTPVGGVSGKPLKEHSLKVVRHLRQYKDFVIIAGGGITSYDDMIDFGNAGANYFAIASGWFNPMRVLRMGQLAQAAKSAQHISGLSL